MNFAATDEKNGDASIICPSTGQPRRTLLVIASHGMLPHSMVHALEREFPWITVEHRTEATAAFARYHHSLALVLLDPAFLNSLESIHAAQPMSPPQPLVALIEHDSRERDTTLALISSSKTVRSVLPMNLRLDIWLSVIRLMLSGGEYYPPQMLNRHQVSEEQTERAQRPDLSAAPSTPYLPELTPREIEVLGMVAVGMQNKAIAAAFSLSEHTVKIHLHNIIAKLGVSNRTQAAAKYREAATRRTADGF